MSHLMPVVDYDYRLAYLLATPSPHPGITLLKVHLATLLSVGLFSLFDLNKLNDAVEEYGSSEVRTALKEELRGPAEPLGLTGVWWTMIALCYTCRQNMLQNMRGIQLRVGKDRIILPMLQGVLIYSNKYEEILSIMGEHGIEVEGETTGSTLTPDHYDSLHRDIFVAFLYQCVLVTGPKDLDRHFYTTATQAELFPGPMVNAMVDFQAIEDRLQMGVSSRVELHILDEDKPLMKDWTRIPARVITKWLHSTHPGKKLSTVLESHERCLPMPKEAGK